MSTAHNFMWADPPGVGVGIPAIIQDVYEETVASSATWNINHGLSGYVIPQIYDGSGNVTYPDKIRYVDADNITVIWPVATAGTIICTFNGSHQYSVSGLASHTVAHGLGAPVASASWSPVTDPIDGLETVLVYPMSETNLTTNDLVLTFDDTISLEVAVCISKHQETVGAGVTDFSFTHSALVDCICFITDSTTRIIWPDEIVRTDDPNTNFDIEGVFTPDATTAFNVY